MIIARFSIKELLEDLSLALAIIQKSSKTTQSSQRKVMFHFKENTLSLYSTNGTYSIKIIHPRTFTDITDFQVLVECEPLRNLLDHIDEEDIDLVFEDDRLVIRSCDNEYHFGYHMGTYSHTTMFELNFEDIKLGFHYDKNSITEALEFVQPSLTSDVADSTVSSVLCDSLFTAHSRYLISIYHYNAFQGSEVPVLLHQDSLDLLKSIGTTEVFSVYKKDNIISVESSRFQLRFPQLQTSESTHNIARSMDRQYPFYYVFPTKSLQTALQRAAFFTDPLARFASSLTFDGSGGLSIKAATTHSSSAHEFVKSIAGTYASDPITHRISLDSLLSMCKVIRSAETMIHVGDNASLRISDGCDEESNIHYHAVLMSNS